MKSKKIITWNDYIRKELRDPEFRIEFEMEEEKLRIAYEIALLRNRARLSQKELARKLKMSQAALARIEGGKQNLTIGTLKKIGAIFGKKLKIGFT